MREALKVTARLLAGFLVLPSVVSYVIRRPILGSGRALEGSTQTLSLIPGLLGDYLRRAFLSRVLEQCHPTATIRFGTLCSQPGARIDANVYVGPRCDLGLVHLERDVLLAAGVYVPSGAATHGTESTERPIREQPGELNRVRIGEGSWIGTGAVVLAHVGCHSVIGAGSVVTSPIPDYSIAAGVPAKVIRSRRPQPVTHSAV